MRYIAAVALVAALIDGNALAANQLSLLKTFQPYLLKDGINAVTHMTADGRAGTIVQLHHQGDNAMNTYDVFIVGIDGNVAWFDGIQGRADAINDSPGDGENVLRTMRFGSAIVDGKRLTVVVGAQRETGTGPMNTPAIAKIVIWALARDDDFDTDYFSKVTEFQTRGKYCDANVALLREAKIAMPPTPEGPASANGC